MILHRLCRTALVAAGLLTTAPVAQAQTPQLRLQADWVGEACVLPATFRVTLTNTGESAFAVPEEGGFGFAGPVNFEARLNEGTFDWNGEPAFSSAVFRTLPPSPDQPMATLAPGQSHVYALPFDGIFDAHGGAAPHRGPWRGQFVFHYTMPEEVARVLQREGPVVPIMDPVAPVTSNVLDCG